MTSGLTAIAAIVTGAVLALFATFGGTAALTPTASPNNQPVVNYDAR